MQAGLAGALPLLGRLLGGVPRSRIHTDRYAADIATAMAADAVTVGSDIYFAAGRADFSRPAGIALLGHELTHVMQHQRGEGHSPGELERAAWATEETILSGLAPGRHPRTAVHASLSAGSTAQGAVPARAARAGSVSARPWAWAAGGLPIPTLAASGGPARVSTPGPGGLPIPTLAASGGPARVSTPGSGGLPLPALAAGVSTDVHPPASGRVSVLAAPTSRPAAGMEAAAGMDPLAAAGAVAGAQTQADPAGGPGVRDSAEQGAPADLLADPSAVMRLADRVYQLLVARLTGERERQGW